MLKGNLFEKSEKKKSLGQFLHEEFGGELIGDVTKTAREGDYEVALRGVPQNIGKTQINESITRFYEQIIGFTRDKEIQLDFPIFYKGKEKRNVRCIVLSDCRPMGDILISVAPLYCTDR